MAGVAPSGDGVRSNADWRNPLPTHTTYISRFMGGELKHEKATLVAVKQSFAVDLPIHHLLPV